MKRIGNWRFGMVRLRGSAGLGVALHWDMRVLDVQVGPWTFTVEGPQDGDL